MPKTRFKPLPPRPTTFAGGTIISFGKYAGWSTGEAVRADIRYALWFSALPSVRKSQPTYRHLRNQLIEYLLAERQVDEEREKAAAGQALLERTYGHLA